VKECSFQTALVWLAHQLGTGAARAATIEQMNAAIAEAEATQFSAPVRSETAWISARKRFLKQTQLPSNLIDQLHEQGLIYASHQGQIVFIERDVAGNIAGAIQCTAQGTVERMASSDKGAVFYVVLPDNQPMVKPDRIVVTDDPIEALSKLTLERTAQPTQRTQYQALGGHRALLAQAEGVSRVEIALSRSDAGDRAAQEICRVIPWARDERPEDSHQVQIKAQLAQLQASLKPLAASQPEQIKKTPQRAPQNTKKQRRERDQGLGL
jgi:uncharacterized protein YndB with AHSA1/START domain